MDYRSETKRCYDLFADDFDTKFEVYVQQYLYQEIAELTRRLPPPATIVDLGSGPGNQALYLQHQGYKLTCIDISETMVEKCRQKGLAATVMDFENLEFPSDSFDGVWAYTSLLHIPKRNLEWVLMQISAIMKPSAYFFLGMKEGSGEGFRKQEKYSGTKRWFSLYTDAELRPYLTPLFDIDFFSRTIVDTDHVFRNYILKRNV